MSHLGIQILYDMFNRREDIWCERVYSPWTDMDRVLREKSEGMNRREKFRLRCYNGDLDHIRLEKKVKRDDLCGKEGVVLTREQAASLLRGEVRPAGAKEPENWEPAPAPEQLFRAPWLRQRLKGAQGAKVRLSGETRYLALPYDPAKPFPLTTLFCFARLRSIGGGAYIVFAFDRQDRPVF